jgi:hypothetical protein
LEKEIQSTPGKQLTQEGETLMESIIIVHLDDGGVMAVTEEAFEEQNEKGGFVGIKYYEHWFDKKEAKEKYEWLV